MKTLKLLMLVVLSVTVFCCSKSDDSSDGDNNPQNGHFSLIVNGDGHTEERFELYRDTVETSSLGLRFFASDDDNNTVYIVLPRPIELDNYGINAYNIYDTSVSSMSIMGNGIYLSTDGYVTFTETASTENCDTDFKGSLNINYRRQDNASGTINVQGTINLPRYTACD